MHAALHDGCTSFSELGVDQAKKPWVHLVLGVEYTDDVAGGEFEGGIECLWLVLRNAVVDDNGDEGGMPCGCFPGDAFGAGIIVADDCDDV